MPKILIDENLSPSLGTMAHDRGFECSHVNHLGKTGQKDWELKKIIVEDDWTFVTNNSVDFRGPYDKPGSSGQYADVRLHAGLVCVNAPRGLNLASQKQLFTLILDDLEKGGDLTNQVMEVHLDKTGTIEIRRRSLPVRV